MFLKDHRHTQKHKIQVPFAQTARERLVKKGISYVTELIEKGTSNLGNPNQIQIWF